MPVDLLEPPTSAPAPVDLLAPKAAPSASPPQTPRVAALTSTAPPLTIPTPPPSVDYPAHPVSAAPALAAPTPSLPRGFDVGPGPTSLAPFVSQQADAEKVDRAGFNAEANLGGYAPTVNNLAAKPEELQNQDLAAGGQAMRDKARDQLHTWLRARDWAAGRTDQTNTRDQFNEQNAQDPFPTEALRYLEPGEAQAYVKSMHALTDPTLQGAAATAPGVNIPEHAAATWKGDIPAFGADVAAKNVENVTDFAAGYLNLPQLQDTGRQARIDLQKASDERRQAAQTIRQNLPQTDIAQAASGQVDLAMQMGASAAVGAITKDPKLAAAVFTGMFSTESASRAWADAKNQNKPDHEAYQDATFAGLKAALISRLPMAWPALAKETAAVQMAGAYLSGTAITTGDAAADEAWKHFVRGEKFDQQSVERIGLAMLQGGTPAALMHGAFHGGGGAELPRTAEKPFTPEEATRGVAPAERGKDALQVTPTDLLAAKEQPATPPTAEAPPPPPPRSNPLDRVQQPQGEPVPRGQRQAQTPQGEAARAQVKDLLAPKPPPPEATPIAPKSGAESGVTAKEPPDAQNPPVGKPAAQAAENAPAVPETVARPVETPAAGGEAGGVGESPLAKLGGKRSTFKSGDRTFTVDYIPDTNDPHTAFITGLASDGTGGKFSDVAQNLADQLKAEGYKDVVYRPDAEDGRDAARKRLFQTIRAKVRNQGSAPAANAGAPPTPAAESTPQGGNVPQRANGEGENGPRTGTGGGQGAELPNVGGQYAFPGTEAAVHEAMGREEFEGKIRRENPRLNPVELPGIRRHLETFAAERAKEGADMYDLTKELSGNFDLEKGGDYWVPTDLAQRLAGRAVAQATARGERKPQEKYERRADHTKGEDARSDVRTILENSKEDKNRAAFDADVKATEPPAEAPKKAAVPTGDPAALKAELDALQKRYAAVHEEMAALRKKKSPRLDARSMRTEADVKIDALNKESWDINTQAKEKRELLNRLNMAELVKTGDPVQRIAAQAEYEGRKVTTEEWEKMKSLARDEAKRQGVDPDSIESAALDAAGMISTHPNFNNLSDQVKAFKVQDDAKSAERAERKKADAERERAAEEADKKGRVERASELKEGAPETSTRLIDTIQSKEGARFLSDGRWMIDTKAIDPANKTFKKINAKKRSERAFVNDENAKEILKKATDGAKDKPPLEDLGYRTIGEEVGRGAKKKTEYKHFRYYADADGQVHAVNAEYAEILKDATGFDSVRAQGRPSEPLVLYKGKKPVGAIMPINIDKGGIDVATARARKAPEPVGNRTDAFGGPIEKKAEKPAAERKPITKNAVKDGIFGKDSFIGGDVLPLAKEGAKAVHEAARQLQSVFAPQTRGEQAKLMQGIAREHGATLAQRSDRALEKLKDARKAFEGNKTEQNYDFIDKMENGEKQDNPQLTDAARRIREMLDGRRREVQALGKGKLEHFIQDYFPHIWEDPEAAAKTFAQILGKRPLEGSKNFLKKRSIDTFSEGIKAGLKPISDNPVDLVLLKLREMDRYILGQKMLAEMKGKGLAKFVPAMERAPEGFTKIDDRIAQVYGPPTVKVEEHVDKAQYDALQQVMDNLGIKHERTTESLGRSKGGKILGLATEGDKTVQTKFATGLGVLAHEVGHQLDYKYHLTDKLLTTIGEAEGAGIHSPTRPPGRFKVRPQSEFDALSKLRFTNVEKTPSKAFRDYNGSTREQMAQVLEAYIHAPDRMREVAPRVFQAFSDFLHSRPELAPLLDARSSLSSTELQNQVAHGGLLKMGEYYAPDAAAGVINNYLSPGLRQKSGLFRAYLGAANVMNQAQLGLSAFHVGFTSMDAMTSKLALGIEQAVEGKPIEALKSLAATPIAPITNIIKGSQLLREWVKPGSEGEDIAKMVNGLRAAGGRAKQDNFYRTNMADKMIKAFKRGNIIGGALRLPAGVLDLVAKPVMEYIVPRQKLGVFADLAQKEMAKLGPDATHDDVRRVLGQAWDSVDNRMGQVVYDNLFWNKAVKDISMASVRSLGWNLGTFRELGGGAIDFAKAGAQALQFKKPEFTHRMAYTLAMPALTGLIGGVLHYAMTGKRPDELKDYFFPKTGETDANGHDVRLSLPSYMKDVYAYAHDPKSTLAHKLHPAIATTIEMLQNKDFYGTKIVNEDDPLMKRIMDRVKYVGGQFIPFGVQGYQKLDEEGAPLSKKVLPFIGITQAPGSVSMTKAEQVAQDLMRERMPVGSRTQAEADRTKAKTDLVREMKAGKPGAADRARAMVQAGTLDREDLKSMLKRSKESPLVAHIEHLDADDALRVWAVASEQERKDIRQQMIMKITRAQRMPQDQKNKARQAIMRGEDVKLPD